MKSKILLFSTLVLGLASTLAIGALPNSFKEAKAYNDGDSYSKSSDHFLAAFHRNSAALEAFEISDHEDSAVQSGFKTDTVITGLDQTSSIDWVISRGKYEYKTTDDSASITLGESGVTLNYEGEGTYDSEYAKMIDSITTHEGKDDAKNGFQSVLFTTTAINNIQDYTITWTSAGVGKLYFLYKESGSSSWTYFTNFGPSNEGDGTNVSNTWNRRAKVFDTNSSTFNDRLKGKTAQLALFYTSKGTSGDYYVRFHTISVNRGLSMKAKIDYWNKNNTSLCKNGALRETRNTYFEICATAWKMTVNEADVLNTAITSGHAYAKENTYWDQFLYFCGLNNISVGVTPTPAASTMQGFLSENKSYLFIIVITSLTAGTLAAALLASKKKKHN